MDSKLSKHIFLILIMISFPFTASLSFTQSEDIKWKFNINCATMKPFFKNDQWFVTSEGYHMHPRTEDYTPGLSLGIERSIFKRVGLELNILYGLPPATLGVVDEFSASGRESLDTERFHFLTITLSPKLYLVQREFGNIYISPSFGYGMLSEITITPSFGPQVTWKKSSKPVFGIRNGFNIRLKNPNVYFNTEVLLLSMKINLEENQTGNTLIKKLGPFGLLLGISYNFD